MTEQVDLKKQFRSRPTYLSHLILESDKDKIREVTKGEDYNIEGVEVSITLNGTNIRVVDYEELTEDYVNRCVKQKLDKYNFNDFQESVRKEATKMMKSQMDKLATVISDLQDTSTVAEEALQSLVNETWEGYFPEEDKL